MPRRSPFLQVPKVTSPSPQLEKEGVEEEDLEYDVSDAHQGK